MSSACDNSFLMFAPCADEVTASGDADADYSAADLIGTDRSWLVTGSGTITLSFSTTTLIESVAFSGLCAAVGTEIRIMVGGAVAETITIEECSGCTCTTLFHRLETPISGTLISFELEDASGGEISACAVLAGPAYPLEVLDGWEIQIVDPIANPRRSLSGTRKVSCGPKWRELSLRSDLPAELKEKLLQEELCKGLSLQILLIIEDVGQCDSTIFLGSPKNLSKFTRQARFNRFSKPLVLEEITCC